MSTQYKLLKLLIYFNRRKAASSKFNSVLLKQNNSNCIYNEQKFRYPKKGREEKRFAKLSSAECLPLASAFWPTLTNMHTHTHTYTYKSTAFLYNLLSLAFVSTSLECCIVRFAFKLLCSSRMSGAAILHFIFHTFTLHQHHQSAFFWSFCFVCCMCCD